MKYLNTKQIQHITLISSESCNLNCSYCEIAKSANLNYNKEQGKKVKDSILNGTFLNNIKDIFYRFEVDPKQIKGLSMWGQEPTLTLDAINTMLFDLFTFFPNINRSMFSSNMVQYPERVLDYIKTVEDICEKLNKNNFNLSIQFSFDGYENTKKNRGIDPNIILNNIEFLIKELNQITFKHTNIRFHFNNVLAKHEIINLDSTEKIKTYWEELDKVSQYFIKLNTNKKVEIRRRFGAGLEFPVNATKDEGKKFSNFLAKCFEIDKQYNDEMYKGYIQIVNRLNSGFSTLKQTSFDFNAFIQNFIDCDFDNNFIEQLSRPLFCGPNTAGFKIRYDGTLVHCHNVIHHLSPESFVNKKGWKYEGLKSLSLHNFYPNAKYDSNEILEDYFYKMRILQFSSFPHIYSLTVKLMTYLRDINQIEDIYYNEELLLQHAILMTCLATCLDGNYQMLSSGVGMWAGVIRYYCNGALSQIHYLNQKQEKNHG